MTDEELRASYGAQLQESLLIRRYTGTSPSRTKVDAPVRGRATRNTSNELVGSVIQHDHVVVVYADDIPAGGVTLPLLGSDKVVTEAGLELAITAIKERKSYIGTLIAYELQARG